MDALVPVHHLGDAQVVPELDQSLVAASTQYHAPKFVGEGGWGVQDTEVWSAFAEFLVTAGLLDEPIDSDAAFTTDFLP